MSRLIHVLIIEQDDPEFLSVGVIDNITIDCEESFKSRLKTALDEHFDADTKIVNEFDYTDLFNYRTVELDVSVVSVDADYLISNHKILIQETWFY